MLDSILSYDFKRNLETYVQRECFPLYICFKITQLCVTIFLKCRLLSYMYVLRFGGSYMYTFFL